MIEPQNMTVEELNDVKIIYIRFKGSYSAFRKQSRKLSNELFKFAEDNKLLIPDITKVLTMYDDNPFITDDKHLRTSIAMTVPNDLEIIESGNISTSGISGKFMVGHFEIAAKEYGDAWQYMYQEWLFKNGNQARDAIPFELYVTEPPKNFEDKSFTDIYIPIN
ncbi:AraC family transcriptional regulator [Enterococcus sp. HY326]|uniref:AraC family transcriptional regulator n=1 Tax=Enterococcus sp. HY326 TaxID=2971265 RepID=UPI00223F8346|nr:GyrI-like domain-containing protein [Enterococcus sp. HY326]